MSELLQLPTLWACKQQSRYNNVGEGSKMVIQTQICDDDHNPKSAMYLPTNYNWCGKRIFARLLRSLSVNSQEWTCHSRCTLKHPVWIIRYVFFTASNVNLNHFNGQNLILKILELINFFCLILPKIYL